MESDRCDRKFGIATSESRISGESQVSVSAIISEWVSHTAALISAILFWILRQLVYKHLIVCSSSFNRLGRFIVPIDDEIELGGGNAEVPVRVGTSVRLAGRSD